MPLQHAGHGPHAAPRAVHHQPGACARYGPSYDLRLPRDAAVVQCTSARGTPYGQDRRGQPGWRLVLTLLDCEWSPQQIVGTLRRVFHNLRHRQMPHETIYTANYAQPQGNAVNSSPASARAVIFCQNKSDSRSHNLLKREERSFKINSLQFNN